MNIVPRANWMPTAVAAEQACGVWHLPAAQVVHSWCSCRPRAHLVVLVGSQMVDFAFFVPAAVLKNPDSAKAQPGQCVKVPRSCIPVVIYMAVLPKFHIGIHLEANFKGPNGRGVAVYLRLQPEGVEEG